MKIIFTCLFYLKKRSINKLVETIILCSAGWLKIARCSTFHTPSLNIIKRLSLLTGVLVCKGQYNFCLNVFHLLLFCSSQQPKFVGDTS